MNKRRQVRQKQQLAVEVAVAVAERLDATTTSKAGHKGLGTTEAKQIATDTNARWESRRTGRMRYRLRRQLAPWWVALGLLVVAGVLWVVRLAGMSAGAAGSVAGLIGAGGVAVAWFVVRDRAGMWRRRLYGAGAAGAVWLVVAAWSGPSAWLLLALVLLTVSASARWWQHHRIPNPKARIVAPVAEQQRHDGPIHLRWARYVGGKGRVLADSYLTDRDTSHAHRETYTVQLDAGKQDFQTVLAQLGKVSSGLDVPVENLIIERHSSGRPSQLRLTIVTKSPIEQTVVYAGPKFLGARGNLINVGPFSDGDGTAAWSMWSPGEEPMSGSWLGGLIIGSTGSGKSRLLELLADGYMATGYAVVLFLDGQGGASSPALRDYADWYVGFDRTEVMLSALERVAVIREMENAANGWSRFDPSPHRPGIIVFVDECQRPFNAYPDRFAELARTGQKLGIGLVGLTQEPSLESLGKKPVLRDSLMANCALLRTKSKNTGNLLPGITLNPNDLPKKAGFGIMLGDSAVRQAPYRAQHLKGPETWFAQRPHVELDQLAAQAAGEPYATRRETAAELQDDARRFLVGFANGARESLEWFADRVGARQAELGAVAAQAAQGSSGRSAASTQPGDAFWVPTFPPALKLHAIQAGEGSVESPGSAQSPAVPAVSAAEQRSEPPMDSGASSEVEASESRTAPRGRELILDVLGRGEAQPGTLQKLTGLSETRVRQLLAELVDTGDVEKVRHGVYRLTQKAA